MIPKIRNLFIFQQLSFNKETGFVRQDCKDVR